MSHSLSNLEYSSHFSKEANEFLTNTFVRVVPSEKFKSQLPPQLKNTDITSFITRKNLADHFIDLIQDMELRDDDVFVCSLPKCGSSFTESIVFLLKNGLNYELDRKKSVSVFESPVIFKTIANELLANDQSKTLTESDALKKAFAIHYDQLVSPRIIKTHIQIYALPKAIWTKQTKLIYIVRNPKDMTVSEYYFRRNHFPPADINMVRNAIAWD